MNSDIHLFSLNGSCGAVSSISFNPDGKHLASIPDGEMGNGTSIHIWDLKEKIVHTLEGHNDIIRSVVFSPNGKYLLSASVDKTAKLWDVESEVLLLTLEQRDIVNSAVFSPNGRQIMTSSYDGSIRIWDFLPLKRIDR